MQSLRMAFHQHPVQCNAILSFPVTTTTWVRLTWPHLQDAHGGCSGLPGSCESSHCGRSHLWERCTLSPGVSFPSAALCPLGTGAAPPSWSVENQEKSWNKEWPLEWIHNHPSFFMMVFLYTKKMKSSMLLLFFHLWYLLVNLCLWVHMLSASFWHIFVYMDYICAGLNLDGNIQDSYDIHIHEYSQEYVLWWQTKHEEK